MILKVNSPPCWSKGAGANSLLQALQLLILSHLPSTAKLCNRAEKHRQTTYFSNSHRNMVEQLANQKSVQTLEHDNLVQMYPLDTKHCFSPTVQHTFNHICHWKTFFKREKTDRSVQNVYWRALL